MFSKSAAIATLFSSSFCHPMPSTAFVMLFLPSLNNNNNNNNNYNKILKSDWFSTALISALIGQFNWTVIASEKILEFLVF